MNSKPYLIFLPGLDGTGRLLFRQTRLHEENDVACENYPQDRDQSYVELADHAAERIRSENDGRPAIVLAESFGGAVALTLAKRHPQLIERMVLSNTFAYFSRRWLIRPASLLSHLAPNSPTPAATRGIRGWALFDDNLPKDIQDSVWERTADVPARAMGRRVRMLAKVDLREQLAELLVPTVILVSPNDRLVPPRCGRLIAERMPKIHLIERRVGHAALLHPQVCIQEILADHTIWDRISDRTASQDQRDTVEADPH